MHTPVRPCNTQALLTGAELPWQSIHAAKLNELYPRFFTWLEQTVATGLADGSRRLFVHNHGGRFGFVIAKRTLHERKLCTIYVEPGSRGNGIASCLISQATDWLGSDKPLLTISEDRLLEFRAIIGGLDFSLTQVAHSYYRSGIREFVFNGNLPNVCDASLKAREQIRPGHVLQARCMGTRATLRGLSPPLVQNAVVHQLPA
jgi:GNAT superfamily N-acetyltransferase